ncbi:MAG TPA: amidohydrolase family protein [Candidatus Limnocylindrales bacterium]|nr:amidohydrolase family protein [Candidatus Limnocylindrales bacterium]
MSPAVPKSASGEVSDRFPSRPPFALRGRIVSPLGNGGSLDIADGVVEVDTRGRITGVRAWEDVAAVDARQRITPDGAGEVVAAVDARQRITPDASARIVDIRPGIILPGLVDLHAHLPQIGNAGRGFGLDLLTWLERDIFPLERGFDRAAAEVVAPAAFAAFAAAGTTTALLYGAVFADSIDASFGAAAAHGIRAVIGKVMMDRLRYDDRLPDAEVLDTSLRESAELCARWHGAEDGRLRYAFTPRFAVSCSPDMLRESAALAGSTGAYWQTHLSEDRGELAEVARLFPDAIDYLDVYDRAGGLGERTILAHAIHLSDREVHRLTETRTRVAHCPASNLFLASGVMPLARYLEAGVVVGLGSDVAAGPDLSIFGAMRVGAYTQNALRVAGDARPILGPLEWLRLATLEGARALSLDDVVGSIEPGKEADLIVVDPRWTDPFGGDPSGASEPRRAEADPGSLISRLMFRAHPSMVRGAWVRGRLLPGPPGTLEP